MSDYVLLDGQMLPYEDAGVPVGNAGLLLGAGLFETLRVRQGKILHLAEHLARLRQSAAILELPLHLEERELLESVGELLEANDLRDARLRLTVTRGDMHQATAEDPEPPMSLLVTAAAFSAYPQELYNRGMSVLLSNYRQNPDDPLTGHKTTSYFSRILALRQAQKAKAGEALWFTPDAYLAEGSISSVFLVTPAGELLTPPLMFPDSQRRLVLPGITRQIVLSLAAKAGIPCREALLRLEDLLAARELFLTNSVMGLMPVSRIEAHSVAEEKPGPLTRQLSELYQAHLEEIARG